MNFKEMVEALRSGSICRLPEWPANVHLTIQDGNFYLFNGVIHEPYELEDAHRKDWMVEPTNGGTW